MNYKIELHLTRWQEPTLQSKLEKNGNPLLASIVETALPKEETLLNKSATIYIGSVSSMKDWVMNLANKIVELIKSMFFFVVSFIGVHRGANNDSNAVAVSLDVADNVEASSEQGSNSSVASSTAAEEETAAKDLPRAPSVVVTDESYASGIANSIYSFGVAGVATVASVIGIKVEKK